MKLIMPLLLSMLLYAGLAFAAPVSSGIDEQQLQQMQERMMGDPKVMALIQSLQNDPEMLVLLADPSFLQAVTSRNVDAISTDPRFVKLMSNPKIREIIRMMQ